jgi:type II secretory ATPase GspE/PulE/Tfp pilus assembly ATPase PilB-like protein
VLQEPGVLSLIVAQRLLPRLCNCRLTYTTWRAQASLDEQHAVQATLAAVAADPGSIRFQQANGCPECAGGRPGYAGRVVCAQVVAFDNPLLNVWREAGIEAARQTWRTRSSSGAGGEDLSGRSIADHAVLRMKRGECDPRDVTRVLDTHDLGCQALAKGSRGLRGNER